MGRFAEVSVSSANLCKAPIQGYLALWRCQRSSGGGWRVQTHGKAVWCASLWAVLERRARAAMVDKGLLHQREHTEGLLQ